MSNTDPVRGALEQERVERVARAICESYGRDPNEQAPLSAICTADNQPVPWWHVYEEQAVAALAALPPHNAQQGYVDAFYALASLMGIPAQMLTPKEVWETQMLPRLEALLAAWPTVRPVNVMDGRTLMHVEDDETGEPLFSIPLKHRAYADLLWHAARAHPAPTPGGASEAQPLCHLMRVREDFPHGEPEYVQATADHPEAFPVFPSPTPAGVEELEGPTCINSHVGHSLANDTWFVRFYPFKTRGDAHSFQRAERAEGLATALAGARDKLQELFDYECRIEQRAIDAAVHLNNSRGSSVAQRALNIFEAAISRFKEGRASSPVGGGEELRERLSTQTLRF